MASTHVKRPHAPEDVAAAEEALRKNPQLRSLRIRTVENLLNFREHRCRLHSEGACRNGTYCTYAHSESELLKNLAPRRRIEEALGHIRKLMTGEIAGTPLRSLRQPTQPMTWYPVDAERERQKDDHAFDLPPSSSSSAHAWTDRAPAPAAAWSSSTAYVHEEEEDAWKNWPDERNGVSVSDLDNNVASPSAPSGGWSSEASPSRQVQSSAEPWHSETSPSRQLQNSADVWQNWSMSSENGYMGSFPASSHQYQDQHQDPAWTHQSAAWHSSLETPWWEASSSWQAPSAAEEEWHSLERSVPQWHSPERSSLAWQYGQSTRPPRVSRMTPSHGRTNVLDDQRQHILDWIHAHDICFIEAATGMGKSTRIPQFVVDHDPNSVVWQLQPRRLAATRLAQYIVNERPDMGPLGTEVGYRVRGDIRAVHDTPLVYMTTGYFLHFVLHHLGQLNKSGVNSNWSGNKRWCTHLFIDEVHEASEETELVLLLVKMLAQRGALNFKVVILSATLDFETLQGYFVKSSLPAGVVQVDSELIHPSAQAADISTPDVSERACAAEESTSAPAASQSPLVSEVDVSDVPAAASPPNEEFEDALEISDVAIAAASPADEAIAAASPADEAIAAASPADEEFKEPEIDDEPGLSLLSADPAAILAPTGSAATPAVVTLTAEADPHPADEEELLHWQLAGSSASTDAVGAGVTAAGDAAVVGATAATEPDTELPGVDADTEIVLDAAASTPAAKESAKTSQVNSPDSDENELEQVLFQQRLKVDNEGEFWESKPGVDVVSPPTAAVADVEEVAAISEAAPRFESEQECASEAVAGVPPLPTAAKETQDDDRGVAQAAEDGEQPIPANRPEEAAIGAEQASEDAEQESAERPKVRVTFELVEENDASLGLRFSESWSVLKVQHNGPLFGRVQAGDCLVAINDSALNDLERSEVHSRLLSRPVKLRLWRLLAEPPRVAAETLQLSQETPYPLTIRYLDQLKDVPDWNLLGLPPELEFNVSKHKLGNGPEVHLVEVCALLLLHLCHTPDDSALVFLPGMTEIEHFCKVLDKRMHETGRKVDMVILHSITLTERCEVRRREGSPNPTAYIASSIAETSITLPELTVVFDFGFSRGIVFDPVLEMEQLTTKVASKTSGKQRAGRVGRTKPGLVFRLYPESVWDTMPQNDNWGGTGTQRSLEPLVLLVAKTLVRYLGLSIRTCLSWMVQPPTEVEIDATLERLEDMDAIKVTKTGGHSLTAFGEFAVCISVLGPRLARLVYCGLIFGSIRLSVVLAAIHAVCGKSEVWNTSNLAMRPAREEDPPDAQRSSDVPPEEALQPLDFSRIFSENHSMGMVLSQPGTEKPAYRVNSVKEGSPSAAKGIRVDDQLIEINGAAVVQLAEGMPTGKPLEPAKVQELLKQRPCTLRFLRLGHKEPSTVSRAVLNHLINVAKYSCEADGGSLSEPVSVLRLVDMYLGRKLKGDNVSLHRLRQIDSVSREIGQKLRQFLQHSRHRQFGKGRGKHNQHRFVLSRLEDDVEFLHFDFESPLHMRKGRWFLSNCFSGAQLARFRLVLCAAFPSNFLIGSLRPKPEKPEKLENSQQPDGAGESAPTSPTNVADPTLVPPPGLPPSPSLSIDISSASQDRLPSSLCVPGVPPMTIRNAGDHLSEQDVISRITTTLAMDARLQLKVEQVQNQPPGNFAVVFPRPTAHDLREVDGVGRITHLTDACLINILSQRDAQRDSRSRLHLLAPPADATKDRQPEVCGELHLVPHFEFRLLRLPALVVRPAARLTPLARVAPLPGIGPEVPAEGPGADGHCMAVAVELEATRLNMREGKKIKMGKAIRSWLVSWLPNLDAIDIVLLMTFWSKEISFLEDTKSLGTVTAFSKLTFGNGLAMTFPEDAPFMISKLFELRDMHWEVQRALRTGQMSEDRLPSVEKLRAWGKKNLAKAKLDTDLANAKSDNDVTTDQTPQATYTHSRGFGFVKESEALSQDFPMKWGEADIRLESPASTEPPASAQVEAETPQARLAGMAIHQSVPPMRRNRGKTLRRLIKEVHARWTCSRDGKNAWAAPGSQPHAGVRSSPWNLGDWDPPADVECVVEGPSWPKEAPMPPEEHAGTAVQAEEESMEHPEVKCVPAVMHLEPMHVPAAMHLESTHASSVMHSEPSHAPTAMHPELSRVPAGIHAEPLHAPAAMHPDPTHAPAAMHPEPTPVPAAMESESTHVSAAMPQLPRIMSELREPPDMPLPPPPVRYTEQAPPPPPLPPTEAPSA